MGTSFDPSDRDMVAEAFVAALRTHQPLARLAEPPIAITTATSTWVWFVELTGVNLPVAWQGPMVLRIFRANETHVAEREDRLSSFLQAQHYPAPMTHLRGELAHPAHPFVMQSRLPGRSAAELLGGLYTRRVLAGIGRLQGQLHVMSTANFPLRRLTAGLYIEHDLVPRRQQTAAVDRDDWLAWLRSTVDEYEANSTADVVVCHGDFHPLNAVVDTTEGLRIGIVDWTDACIADRHLDVGRSVAIYWFASIIADSAMQRRALRLARRWMADLHLKTYQKSSGVRLDKRRLTWWQIVHLYRGWLQLSVMADGTLEGPPSSTAERFTAELRDQLLERCRTLRATLDR